jgi:hypothetical protein
VFSLTEAEAAQIWPEWRRVIDVSNEGERAMARKSSGLAKRLAAFFSAIPTPDPPAATPRRMSVLEKRRLASRLLGTLSVQALAETGYKERRARRRGVTPPERGPSPRPVGDLSRVRVHG